MTAHKPGDPTTLNRLYGRSKGKPLRAGQQDLVDTMLPQIAVPAEGEVTAARLFGGDCPLHFENGFGGGEHMTGRADMLPDHRSEEPTSELQSLMRIQYAVFCLNKKIS